MKKSKILLHSDIINNEESPKEIRAGKLLKSILVFIMLSWITILFSCVAFIPVQGHEGHGEHHGNVENNGHGENHGHDNCH